MLGSDQCFSERKSAKLKRNTQEMGESDSSAIMYCDVRGEHANRAARKT